MTLQPPPTVTDWIPDSGATNDTTPHAGNIFLFRPLDLTTPSIVVGNGATLPVSSVGDTVLPGPLYLNNILHTPHIIQNLLSVHCFTTNNYCSMEFDPFGVSVKDLNSRNVIIRSNSAGPLYTLRLPSSSSTTPCALAAVSTPIWHRCLGHPGTDILSQLSSSSAIHCSHSPTELCHACQLGCHTRLPFSSSTSCTTKPFELIHCDLWTSPIASVSGYKYYLVILDDHTHYLWTYPLRLKSDTFDALSSFFAYVSIQLGSTIKNVQCNNGREFDHSTTRSFLLTRGTLLRMSCPYTSPQNGKAERCTINNIIRSLLF
jgi:hypothetical protein